MANKIKYIKTILLSDGSEYKLSSERFDEFLPLAGGTITGDLNIDEKLKTKKLVILSVQETTEVEEIDNVLTAVGNDSSGYEVKRRDKDKLLEDIGGYSANVFEETLNLKLGK